ncbi:ABC transporter ATP-binding protein [Legionella israelensis]|uniref:ABC-type dipeptide transporter n=1 Tax=Legionella israelensis TaxID=454 RepID=A0A0W0W111_9GAMM|nr:ABC transporter ATP-binding protein [Legionella israelensis]KTD26060.1 ABC dipeptide/oligopeptide/nickel transport, ATPase component [Legionella israelensis]QBS10150.1 ABC transporter ATP-binding protein [Legionella israelensis]SCY26600.1 peptide/nickel transport system ATP-binding protein [Legionella israelensis DSM 19235]STX59740.1 ABC dipeptide/oligopeptide/nickel transport, ATPase component [Legionella israelensis]
MENIAEIKQLSIAFQERNAMITAVKNVSFQLRAGETLALLGESGCGKSLTSLAIMRLLPENAVYGSLSKVFVDNDDLLNLPEQIMQQLRGCKLAMIFQEPMTALNPVLTIGQQLSEILLRQEKMTRSALKESMIALLKEVDMPQPHLRVHQYPHQLSGGQKQRVVIAMALACNPQILIADEPTTALDVTVQAQILALLKKLQKRYQMSLLLITHDLGVVKAVADQVCVMYAGEVVEQADVSSFFTEARHPYVQQLLASVPSFDLRNQHLSVISGTVPALDHMPSGCRFHPRCDYVFQRCQQVEPELQTFAGRTVRCHLYPEHSSLPTLQKKESKQWIERSTPEKALLSVEHLSVYFKQRHGGFPFKKDIIKAVDDVSFQLYKGQTLALVGESGCGKTTISRALLQLVPATAGQVLYQKKNALGLRGRFLNDYRKKVQIIFQDPFSAMNPRMTIGEILAEGMKAQGVSKKRMISKQRQLLEQVGLSVTGLSRYPHQFSGGQRQRICIARALAMEPEILICDEPTSALDVSVQAQILNLLKEVQQETGLSYLFITHNMGVVAYIADDVMVMREGKIIETGSCEEVLHKPKHAYTQQLLSAVLEV